MKRRIAAMALLVCLFTFPAQAEASNAPFVRRAEAIASEKSGQGMWAAAQREADSEEEALIETPAQSEIPAEVGSASKETPFTSRAKETASERNSPFAVQEKAPAVSALEPGTQEAALCEYAERQAEALIAARSADEGMAESLGAPDAEMLQRLAAMEGAKPAYAALLLPSNGFGREEILDESGCGEEMLPTVAFELVYAANRGHADDAFAAWADRYSLYGVYAGDAPELGYVELIYGEDLPQTVTVFVRAADGTCLTRTSFVCNPSAYPEEIYMALPALADSFWEGLDTQVCALPEE